jgi:hypothetical protein
MTDNNEAVSVLGPLLRSTDDPCPLILLGAGASFRSGVPTAADAVKQIARLVFSERVKPSEWESWLQGFDWFLPGADRLAENFPLVVEHLLVPAEFRKRVLLDLMRPVNGISAGYRMLADFVLRGLISTIFTTNFDTCLPDALREKARGEPKRSRILRSEELRHLARRPSSVSSHAGTFSGLRKGTISRLSYAPEENLHTVVVRQTPIEAQRQPGSQFTI